MSLRDL